MSFVFLGWGVKRTRPPPDPPASVVARYFSRSGGVYGAVLGSGLWLGHQRNNIQVASATMKVLPWVVDGAGGLGAGKTSGTGTRGVDLNAAVGGRTGYTDTNGGESSNN